MRALGAATGATWAITKTFSLLWKLNPFGALITGAASLAAGVYSLGYAFGWWGNEAEKAGRKAADAINQVDPQGAQAGFDRQRNLAELRADLPPAMLAQVDAAGGKKEAVQKVVEEEITRIEEALKKERENLPLGLADVKQKFDIVAAEAEGFKKFYGDELKRYQQRTGQADAWWLPKESPEYGKVMEESTKIMRKVAAEADKKGLPLSADDMAPLTPSRAWQPNTGVSGALWGGGRFVGGTAPAPMPRNPSEMLGGEKKIGRLEGLLNTVTEFGKAIGAQKGKTEDFVLPGGVQAKYTDAISFRESVQLAGLNKVDTQIDLVRKQLEIMSRQEGLLKTLNDYQSMVIAALARTRPVVGK
jgi:hypothetical protein